MKNSINTKRKINTRAIAATAMLSALAYVLMFIEVSLPMIIPSFIKFDLSDFPALVASFAYGPLSGIAVCFVKNLINFFLKSQTGGVGELSNFILGAVFIIPAGFAYKFKKTRAAAALGAVAGAFLSAVISFFTNYYIVYPIYTKFMPMEAIVGAYRAILPSIENLKQALLIFNVPFTFCKFAIVTVLTFLIYKRISPILKGKI